MKMTISKPLRATIKNIIFAVVIDTVTIIIVTESATVATQNSSWTFKNVSKLRL